MWTQPKHRRLTVTPGFPLLLGGLFWLDEGIGLLPLGLLACLIHELGHIAAAAVCGGRIERLSLSIVGAELFFCYRTPLSYWQDSFIALAGPIANMITGGVFFTLNWYLPAAASLGIGAFNLLPAEPLDGGKVLFSLLAEHLNPDLAERLMTALAGCLAGALVGIGMIAAVQYANVTLLLTALWLLMGILCRRNGKETLVKHNKQP